MSEISGVSYLIQVNLVLVLLFLCYRLLLDRETFFRLNRYILLGMVGAAFVMPLIELPGLSSVFGTALLGRVGEGVVELHQAVGVSTASFPEVLVPWLYGIYAAGLLAGLVRLGRQMYRLHRLKRTLPSRRLNGVTLIRTAGTVPTFSFLRSLFWDENVPLTGTERRWILRHELAHIRGGHSFDVLLLELVGILCWFNPAVYLIRRHLRDVHEFLADRAAAGASEGNDYERLLVRQFFRDSGLTLANAFMRSPISRRLDMLRRGRPQSKALYRYAAALPPVLAVLVLFSRPAPAPVSPPLPPIVLYVPAMPEQTPAVDNGTESADVRPVKRRKPGSVSARIKSGAPNASRPHATPAEPVRTLPSGTVAADISGEPYEQGHETVDPSHLRPVVKLSDGAPDTAVFSVAEISTEHIRTLMSSDLQIPLPEEAKTQEPIF